VKTSIGAIRAIIREQWYLEAYDHDMLDDEAFNKESLYVPDKVKRVIKSWLVDMGLSKRSKGNT